ncbi:bifunctional glutamine synthetase adenylyltransferase/deadenyltransferase [Gammaproteobacteria bacterium 42_54_T18]|nr:bifunctional glutamine synthetase adenylyltransferase/deadenyltransferase [Gammaproteobacteria bacterium 42_54_T18]
MRTFDLSLIPESLQAVVTSKWSSIEDAMENREESADLSARLQALPKSFDDQFPSVAIASDYALDQCSRKPELLLALWEQGVLSRQLQPDEIQNLLQAALVDVTDEKALSVVLRRFRQFHMVRIIWRDSCRLSNLMEVTRDLTELADACVAEAMALHYQWLQPSIGLPYYENTDTPMKMVVLGMGKLGAFELNLSSDIDLMFVYPQEGETQGGKRSLSHREFFTRLGQKLIKALDETTAEGFVFRVDMRLRPYGSTGALALSFDGMKAYYEEQGREWERYAMIKARAMGEGDGEELMARLRPFVYRRYIDFGVIESLREMKGMINREVLRRGVSGNVKTGSGGIREIEFIGQAFQLIRGGQDTELQERSLLKVLKLVAEMGLMPEQAVKELSQAYVYLREVEHRIQALHDRQTQVLPDDALQQERIAWGMHKKSWEEFTLELDQCRLMVRQHFDRIISPEEGAIEDAEVDDVVALWNCAEGNCTEGEDIEENVLILKALGFEDASDALRVLKNLKISKGVQHLQELPRQRLNKLMPLVITVCSEQECSLLALERIVVLIEAILRRSAYMALLVENTEALKHLATLCGASAWAAEIIQRYPILLDELINPNTLYSPPTLEELRDDLRQQMLRIPEDDAEREMECLRQFKHAHLLRVAASDITGTLPTMKVSDYLTWIAEALMQQVLVIAWKQMVDKYGTPLRADGTLCDPDFIIVGYGKAGGIELSYGSDLDLVFIHDAPSNHSTDGERSVDNSIFYARLGQRIIHIVSTRTASGMLYETDMRLRPSGNSGLLVSSLNAFVQYQDEKAWTWEHQALVRARVVAGCPALAERFEQERQNILKKAANNTELAVEVLEMRTKMRDHLAGNSSVHVTEEMTKKSQRFDLKQDSGGIVDIEFLVQYCVLHWGAAYPELLRWTDNVRILDTLETLDLLDSNDVLMLEEAYLTYRHATHRKALQNQKNTVPGNEFITYRMAVRAFWAKLLPEGI